MSGEGGRAFLSTKEELESSSSWVPPRCIKQFTYYAHCHSLRRTVN